MEGSTLCFAVHARLIHIGVYIYLVMVGGKDHEIEFVLEFGWSIGSMEHKSKTLKDSSFRAHGGA